MLLRFLVNIEILKKVIELVLLIVTSKVEIQIVGDSEVAME